MHTTDRRSHNPGQPGGGFSLIELLTAISILAIIVLMVGMIFSDSNRAWVTGSNRVQKNTDGRAALNMIEHDLQYAIADERISFHLGRDRSTPPLATYNFTNSEICFVSLLHDSSTSDRTAYEIHYWVRESPRVPGTYELVRGFFSDAISDPASASRHCYWNTNWYKTGGTNPGRPGGTGQGIVAENVAALTFFAPDGSTTYDSGSYSNRLPEYVDVYLEILSDAEAEQAAIMKAAVPAVDYRGYVERTARRYTTRVFFVNRHGYRKR